MDTSNELQPKEQWLEERFEAVCKAIAGRYESLNTIPIDWIEEYNELSQIVKSTQKDEGTV